HPSATCATWQCSFLRAGRSYRWSVPTLVAANATLGRPRLATALATELGSGPLSPRTAQVSVWIVLDMLSLSVQAYPSSTAERGTAVNFTVTVANTVLLSQVNASNERNFTAYNVRIAIGIGPLLDVANTTPRLIVRANLTPSELVSVTFPGIVAGGAGNGDLVWVNATLLYADMANLSIGPGFAEQVLGIRVPATLDEFAFAGRKAAVLRGRHVVLAALLSRGSPRYLFSQLKAVERALEAAHGVALADWDGRVSSLDQAGPILEALLAGRYRRIW